MSKTTAAKPPGMKPGNMHNVPASEDADASSPHAVKYDDAGREEASETKEVKSITRLETGWENRPVSIGARSK